MSSLALFLTLGGGAAWAANEFTGANVRNETLTGTDVKNETLTSADVRGSSSVNGTLTTHEIRDGSLYARDFRSGQLPAGPRGPEGATGPAGPEGPKGDDGATGATGPKGDKGDACLSSNPACRGPQGPAGATGPTGAKGDKGDACVSSDPACRGPQGPAGTSTAFHAQGLLQLPGTPTYATVVSKTVPAGRYSVNASVDVSNGIAGGPTASVECRLRTANGPLLDSTYATTLAPSGTPGESAYISFGAPLTASASATLVVECINSESRRVFADGSIGAVKVDAIE